MPTDGSLKSMTLRSLGLVELAGRRVLRLEDLGVLVVDHRLGDIEVALEQARHVEVLLDDVLLGRVEAGLRQGGEQLGLVAAEPAADLLAGHLRRGGDVLVLERGHPGAGALEVQVWVVSAIRRSRC